MAGTIAQRWHVALGRQCTRFNAFVAYLVLFDIKWTQFDKQIFILARNTHDFNLIIACRNFKPQATIIVTNITLILQLSKQFAIMNQKLSHAHKTLSNNMLAGGLAPSKFLPHPQAQRCHSDCPIFMSKRCVFAWYFSLNCEYEILNQHVMSVNKSISVGLTVSMAYFLKHVIAYIKAAYIVMPKPIKFKVREPNQQRQKHYPGKPPLPSRRPYHLRHCCG